MDLPRHIVGAEVHRAQLLGIGGLDAFQVAVEDLLESRPQQHRDAVEQRVKHGDAATLHHQTKQMSHLEEQANDNFYCSRSLHQP